MSSQHKTSRHELTPIERAYLIGRHDASESFNHISHETGVPKTTVINTVQNAKTQSTTNSLPRSRPRKTDVRDDRILCREARKGPRARRIPLAAFQANIQPCLSHSTISRRLKEHNIQKWLAKGRIRLKPEHKRARYKWACEHFNWLKED